MFAVPRVCRWGWLNPSCVRRWCILEFMQKRRGWANQGYFLEDSSAHCRQQVWHCGKQAVPGLLGGPAWLYSQTNSEPRIVAYWVAVDPRSRRWDLEIGAIFWISFSFGWECQFYLRGRKRSSPATKVYYCFYIGSRASTCRCRWETCRVTSRNQGWLSYWWGWWRKAGGGIWTVGWRTSLRCRRILLILPELRRGTATGWIELCCRNSATDPAAQTYSQPLSNSAIALSLFRRIPQLWPPSLMQPWPLSTASATAPCPQIPPAPE